MIHYLKLIAAVLAWGGTFTAAKFAVADASVEVSALLRFTLASLILLLIIHRQNRGFPTIDRHQLVYVLILGASGVAAYNLFFFSGLKTVEAGRGALIITSNPIWVALGAALLFRQRFNLANLVGFVVCAFGVSIVLSRGDLPALFRSGVGQGELAMLGCALSWSVYTLTGKHLMNSGKPLPPLTLVAYSCVSGSLILLVHLLLNPDRMQLNITGSFIAAILYLAVLGTAAGFVWFFEGVREIGAAQAAAFVFFVPVSAVFFGIVLLNEELTLALVAGAALILTGVALINRPLRARVDG